MQLPIPGTIATIIPIHFADQNVSQSKDALKQSAEAKAGQASPASPTQSTYSAMRSTTETLSSLMALQEDAAREPSTRSIDINGLSIIVSGHSVDARDGVSLLRTISPSDAKSMMAMIASMEDDADRTGEDGAQQETKSGSNIIRLDMHGGIMEVESEALGPLPDGATSVYMNEDFFHSNGAWSNGNPIEKSNLDGAVVKDRRTRLNTLMNSVDAERQLRARYGEDVKLVYSHSDKSYIMLTPDDAKYDTLKSAESSVQDVMNEVRRGYIDKNTVADILQRYGYHI